MQELDVQPLSIADQVPHQAEPNNGEGLIWDSEVKVQVDEMQFEMLSTPTKDGKSVPDLDIDDDERQILESHVEVKVDFESSSISGEPSSPLFPSSATRSYPSSLEASPPTSTYQTKRFGFALPEGVTYDLDTADDDSDDYPEIYDWTSSPLFRGRSLTRKKLTSFEIYGVSPNGSDASIKGKGLSRLKSLRSLSSNLRSVSNTKIPDKDAQADSSPADKPRTLLRGLRSRKSSPLLTSKLEPTSTLDSQVNGPYGNLESKATKKSGLRNWAKFMIPERKRNKHVPLSQLRNQTRSCAPSPTGSWARTQEDNHEEMPILASNSGTMSLGGRPNSPISQHIEGDQATEAINPSISDLTELPAEMPPTVDHRQSVKEDENQENQDEKTVNDLTLAQDRAVPAPEELCEAPQQQPADDQEVGAGDTNTQSSVEANLLPQEETRERSIIVEDEIKDQPPVKTNVVQVEETAEASIVASYAIESERLTVDSAPEKDVWASEETADPSEALLEGHDKQNPTPRSSFMQSIIESSNVRPHPPRKSSLRQMLSPSRNAPSVPKFSFPLPRHEPNKRTLDEGERGLLSANARDF